MKNTVALFAALLLTNISQGQTNTFSATTNLAQQLYEKQMESLRSGKPMKPIQLTPEMDAELVKEGVLPAKTTETANTATHSPDVGTILFNFSNSPLPHVTAFYSDLTGKKVLIDSGIDGSITATSSGRLTIAQTLLSIERILADSGFKMTAVGTNTIRVHQEASTP